MHSKYLSQKHGKDILVMMYTKRLGSMNTFFQ